MLLVVLFVHSLLLVNDFFKRCLTVQHASTLLHRRLSALAVSALPRLRNGLPIGSGSLIVTCVHQILRSGSHPTRIRHLLTSFRVATSGSLTVSGALAGVKPVLKLVNALVPVKPTLIKLSANSVTSVTCGVRITFTAAMINLFSDTVNFVARRIGRH